MIARLTHGAWEPILRVAFLLLIFGVFARFDRIAAEANLYLRRAWQEGVDYQAIRMKDPLYASAFEARRLIPDNAPWNASRKGDPWAMNRAMYTLYPNVNLVKDWQFFLDVTGEIKEPDPAWQKRVLATGAVLYARNGGVFLDPPRAPEFSYGNAAALGAFAMVALAQLLFGVAVLAGLRVPLGPAGALWHLATAYLIGFIALHALSWILLIAGLPFRAGVVAGAWGVALAIALLLTYRRVAETVKEMLRAEAWRPALPDTPWGWFTMAVVVFVAVCLLLPIVLVPAWSFDVLGHWFYKAKALVHREHMSFLLDANVPEYPLTWTLQAATLFLFSGGPRDETMQWSNALMIVVLLVQLQAGLLHARVSRAWAWVGLLCFLTFFFQTNLTWSYADTPFLTYLAAVLAALALPAPASLWLGMALAVGLALIKLEGGVAVILVAGAYFATRPGFLVSPKAWRALFLLAAPALLGFASQFYVTHMGYGPGGTHMKEAFSLERLQLLITRVVDSVDGNGMGWRLFAGAALVLLVRPGRRWTRNEVMLGLVALPLILFSAFALIGWSTADIDKQTMTATDRLILHATPALLLLFGSVLAAPPDEGEDPA